MSVETKRDSVDVAYTINIAVSGAEPVQKKFSKLAFSPNLLTLLYRETASGWTLASATVSGRRILKAGLGQGCAERLRSSDEWPEWVRSAVQQYAPKGSLR